MFRYFRLIGPFLLLSLALVSIGNADTNHGPHFTSMGGVGYTSVCDADGLTLKSLYPTYRLRGYRSSIQIRLLNTETVIMKSNCEVTSPELGHGFWCESNGSNAGFEIDFLSSSLNKVMSPNRMSFFGQEPFCKFIVNKCFCDA